MDLRKRLVCLPIVFLALAVSPFHLAFGQSSSVGTGIQSLYISGFVRDEDTHESLKAVTVSLRRGGGGGKDPRPAGSRAPGEGRLHNAPSGAYRLPSKPN